MEGGHHSLRRARPRNRSILKKTGVASHQAFTIALLLLSLIILTLSILYASCVALPHSSSSAPSLTDSVRTSQRRNDPTGSSAQAGSYLGQNLTQAAESDHVEQDSFMQSAALASLAFYALTLPVLTMLHAGTELMILCIRPEILNTTLPRQSRFRKFLPVLSGAISVALFLGWIAGNLVWMNCEITNFSPMAGQKICPIQVLGHHMGGVDELSIAKVAFAWMTVLAYLCYIFYTQFLSEGHNPKRRQDKQRARFALTQVDQDDGREDVLIGLEDEVIKDIEH